ncbi:MAG: hypothetical protein H0X51_04215 [Parachlamydiaceae bacterium]|nr:hypothetical protein [Parachlamydiaceae bacterium]
MTSLSRVSAHTLTPPVELTKEQQQAIDNLPSLDIIRNSIIEHSSASTSSLQVEREAMETYQHMRQSALVQLEAPQRIAAVKWPASYAPLLIQEALILNVMEVMQAVQQACPNSTLPLDVNGLFIALIEQLNKRPFHLKNEEMFSTFQKKFINFFEKANIKLGSDLLNAIKTFKLLQKVAATPGLDKNHLSDYPDAINKGTHTPDLNKTLMTSLYAFNASVVLYMEATFRDMPSAEQINTLLSIAPIVDQKQFIQRYQRLRNIFHARKNLLLQRQNDIKQQIDMGKASPFLSYICSQQKNDAKLLLKFLKELQAFLATTLEYNQIFFSPEQYKAMEAEERLYLLDDEKTTIDSVAERATSQSEMQQDINSIFTTMLQDDVSQAKMNMFAIAEKALAPLMSIPAGAHPDIDKSKMVVSKMMSKLQSTAFSSSNSIGDSLEMFLLASQLFEARDGLVADAKKSTEELARYKTAKTQLFEDHRASRQRKKLQQLQQKKVTATSQSVEDMNLKDTRRFLFKLKYKIETCGFGLSALQTQFENILPRLLPSAQTVADLETSWVQHYDELVAEAHAEAETKTEAEGERKVAAAHTTDGEATETPSSAVEAPATAMTMQVATKAFKPQPMTLNSVVRTFTILSTEATRSQLSLKDSGYHWTLFMQNVEMLRDCLATNQQFQPAFVTAFTRHASTMCEQDLAAEAGIFLHSQVQLAKRVALVSQLPEGETKEMGSFVADVDQGTLSHRYPTSMQRMYQSRHQTPPQTVQWLIKPDSCTPKDLTAFATSAIQYMETRHAGRHSEPDHTLSKQWTKTPAIALTVKEIETSQELTKNLKQAFSTISQMTTQVEIERKMAHSQEDAIQVTAYSEALHHLNGLHSALSRWIACPKISVLAANGDLIWTHLQFFDEQIGTALSGTRTHNLEKLRELVGRTETLEHTQVVTNINIDIGAHYPYFRAASYKGTTKPEAISWRLQAARLAAVDDESFTTVTKKKSVSGNKAAALQATLIKYVYAVLEMAQQRLPQ